jgi:hypothetical protein
MAVARWAAAGDVGRVSEAAAILDEVGSGAGTAARRAAWSAPAWKAFTACSLGRARGQRLHVCGR